MVKIPILGCFVTAMMFLAAQTFAQTSRWGSLDQIHLGAKIRVVEQNLKSTTGQFVRFSETDLTLKVNGQEIVIPRDKVYRVSLSGKNRKRNVLIGLGVGAAAGVGVGAAVKNVVGDAKVIPGLSAAYAGVGAGVGALMPASREIYRAEAKTPDASAMSKVSSAQAQLTSTDRREPSLKLPNEKP